MKRNQVKWGVVLSYLLIGLNAIYGLLITPYVLGCLGEGEYGVYKTVSSLSASLMVLDLGIGGTVMRYVAAYRSSKEDERIPNFIAMNLVQAAVLCGVILAAAALVFQGIEPTYSSAFSSGQIQKAEKLFVILVGNMVLHVFENVFNGVITGYNRFLFGNGIKVLRLLARIVLIYMILPRIADAVALVWIDVSVTILFFLAEIVYCTCALKLRIRLTQWEKETFFDAGKYTGLMFLTSVAAQVNSNLDNVIIGAFCGPEKVAVYSVGLVIFGVFMSLSTAVSGVLLPTVTDILQGDKAEQELYKLIVRAGRLQFMMLGAAVVGFACVGREFLSLWLGEGFEDVYAITLILMIPALFELCVNVCLAILRAMNRLTFRTWTLTASTALNAFITFLAVKYWSYIGAAFGTAASFAIGSVLVMNVYYKKRLDLPMLKIYHDIFSKIWICLLTAGVGLSLFSSLVKGTAAAFIAGVVVFAVIYGTMLLLFGFNQEEKKMLKQMRRKCHD